MGIWVLVADAGRARLFKAVKRNGPLEELRDWVHPASRQHERDLVSDDDGSQRGPAGRHGVDSEPVHKLEEEERFAQELMGELEKAAKSGEFSRLYLVAAPKFLGMLRKHAPADLLDKVPEQIAKDLSAQDAAAIRKALPEYL